jgi:hypothetical protein
LKKEKKENTVKCQLSSHFSIIPFNKKQDKEDLAEMIKDSLYL